MCDTIVASPGATRDGALLFGKNSDRYRNEAQAVECLPARDHAPGTELKCTYITIPDVAHTYAVLISRPFWIWGAEMGANEFGVVIGNEGLQARVPALVEPALIGMDLLRLALERASTATEAVEVITSLLERYGQGGDCGHLTRVFYNNGFIIADAGEAFVLETVGREWLVERITDVRAISNVYSIGERPERTSNGLRKLLDGLVAPAAATSDYAKAIAHPDSQHIGQSAARQMRATQLLRSKQGRLKVQDMIGLLRDHGADSHQPRSWKAPTESNRTLCLHAGSDKVAAQTTGSLVSRIDVRGGEHWVTGTSAPCISIFKPVLLEASLPFHGPPLSDRFDPDTLWWRHERMHRAALQSDFARFVDDICEERDDLEVRFRASIDNVRNGGTAADRDQAVAACWSEAAEAEARWYSMISSGSSLLDSAALAEWQRMGELAGLR